MSQYRRLFIPGASYFFTVVTYQRQPIFCQEPAVQRLRQAFHSAMQRFPFTVDSIVVLPDHLHCIWSLPNQDHDFPKRWQFIKRFVSLGIPGDKNHRREKTIWQRRYWEHCLRNEKIGNNTWIIFITTLLNTDMFKTPWIGPIVHSSELLREVGIQ